MHVSVLVSIGCVALALVSMTCGAAKAEDDGFCPEPDFGCITLAVAGFAKAPPGEEEPPFPLDQWAPPTLGGPFIGGSHMISGEARGTAHPAKVHHYRLFRFASRPGVPLPKASEQRYVPHVRCMEGDFFPIQGHLYHADFTEPYRRSLPSYHPFVVGASRVDRDKTATELRPSLDRYLFPLIEAERVGLAGQPIGNARSSLYEQPFVVTAIDEGEGGEPVARMQFGWLGPIVPAGAPSWHFDCYAPRAVRVGDVLRFGTIAHRVTRIVPSQEDVTIDGREGYLVGWIEVDPVPVEERLAEKITNSIGMTLRRIPAGEFLMGSPPEEERREVNERPQHGVRIERPFYLAATPVTQDQYEQVMGAHRSSVRSPDRPVTVVSWHDAVEFCRRLSEREGRPYRLPTEAEWEYACRAGTSSRFFWGESDDEAVVNEYAWCRTAEGPQPVGQKRANPWGLYDMSGNVWEWCADEYEDDYYRDVPGDSFLERSAEWPRVIRGGSANNAPRLLRSAARRGFRPTTTSGFFGFRVALSLDGWEEP